jgi:glycosyltransferase involved in cell wall biosynthesis
MDRGPLRILLVEFNEDGTVGGSHQAQYDLVRRLDRSRYQPVVAYYQGNRFVAMMHELGVEVHILEDLRRLERRVRERAGRAPRLLDSLTGAILRRRRFLLDHKIALVHLNNSPATGADDWLPAARLAGLPCVTFSMGNAPDGLGPVHRRLARSFDRILVIGEHVRATYREQGYPASLLTTTQIGVDLESFRSRVVRTPGAIRREVGVASDKVMACMVGNLRHWKGQHVVVEALARMDPLVRSGLVVLFVGSVGPEFEEYAGGLHREVERLGLEGCVRFLGGRTDVPDLLGASDLGLHASVVPEPFGLVVVEAMAMGLPVVATSIGAPGRVVTPECGRTFDPSEPGELAGALEELVTNPELRRSLGAAALARADGFHARGMVEATERVYADLLA